MSTLTLVRHAQASLFAANYDELSPLGREQSRLLGEFWARRGTDFEAVYSGPRARQRQTAELAWAAASEAGRKWPEPVVVEELDEYDLMSLLQDLAPVLARENPAFAELQARYRADEGGPERKRSFQKMFEALTMHWATAPGPPAGVEAFAAFRERVARGLRRITEGSGSGRRVAAFTSGGFIGTAARLALDAPDRVALELSWRLRNCSLTEFVFTKGRLTLDGFNTLPHLEDPALWTYW